MMIHLNILKMYVVSVPWVTKLCTRKTRKTQKLKKAIYNNGQQSKILLSSNDALQYLAKTQDVGLEELYPNLQASDCSF